MIKVKNLWGETKVYAGQELASGAEYSIPANELQRWGEDQIVLTDVLASKLQVSDHNGVAAATVVDAISLLRDEAPKKVRTLVAEVEMSLRPRGFGIEAPAGEASIHDWEFDTTLRLRGGKIFAKDAVVGDWVQILIIDKANVVGMGGTEQDPTILKEYVKKLMVFPDTSTDIEDVDCSDPILQGLFMRIVYHSTGATAVKGACNLMSYEES